MVAVSTADQTTPMTVDDAIEHIGVGRFQWRLLLVSGLTWAVDAMEVLMIGFLIGPVAAAFNMERPQAAYIGSMTFAGMFLGALVWGRIADRIGRRKVFLWTVLQTAVFGTLAAFSPNFTVLLLLRFLTGTAMGGTLPVDYAIMAEYLPTKERGRFLIYLESFWALGTIAVAALAWAFIPQFPVYGWRFLMGVSAVIGLLGYWIRRSVPESPRYLMLQGRVDEARTSLERVANINNRPLVIGELVAETKTASTGGSIWRPALVRRSIMLSIMWFSLALGYYGIFTWLPSIFAASGFTFIQQYAYPLQLALAFAQIPGYILAAILIDRWGRKPTLAAYLTGGALFSFLFAAATTPTLFVVFSMLLSFVLLGAWGALYVLTPEMFPTEVRATGTGWASAMARVAGIIAPFVGARLSGNNLGLALAVYAGFFIIACIATLLVGPETRNARLADRADEGAL